MTGRDRGFDTIYGVNRFLENNNTADTTAIRFDGNLGNVLKYITSKKIRFVLRETETHRLRYWFKTMACLFKAKTAVRGLFFHFRLDDLLLRSDLFSLRSR